LCVFNNQTTIAAHTDKERLKALSFGGEIVPWANERRVAVEFPAAQFSVIRRAAIKNGF